MIVGGSTGVFLGFIQGLLWVHQGLSSDTNDL